MLFVFVHMCCKNFKKCPQLPYFYKSLRRVNRLSVLSKVGANSGAETDYPSGVHEVTHVLLFVLVGFVLFNVVFTELSRDFG
jgi:hypothetical protein